MSVSVSYAEEEDNSKEKVVTIFNSADPVHIFKIMESDFERWLTIDECLKYIYEIINAGGVVPPNAPWWFCVAMDYLGDLYAASNINKIFIEIIIKIRLFKIIIDEEEKDISKKEKKAIAVAMQVIHQYKLLPCDENIASVIDFKLERLSELFSDDRSE